MMSNITIHALGALIGIIPIYMVSPAGAIITTLVMLTYRDYPNFEELYYLAGANIVMFTFYLIRKMNKGD